MGKLTIFREWTPTLALAAAYSALGGFTYGYDNSWWAGVLGSAPFNERFGSVTTIDSVTGAVTHSLSASEQSNGTGLGTVGVMLGIMMATVTNRRLGRKGSFLVLIIVGVIGGLIEALATIPGSYYMLGAGKIIINASTGIAAATSPLYQAEVAPAHIRGSLSNFYVVMNTLGSVIATAVIWKTTGRNDSGSWLIAICLQFLPPIAMLIMLPFCPESPRWLVEQGRDDDAVEVVRLLRGSDVDPVAEVALIREGYEADKALHAGARWAELFRGCNLRRTLLAMGLQCLQQGQGVSYMSNYLLVTFQSLGFADVYKLLFALYIMMFGLNLFGFVLPDLFGRRILLICGATGMFICQAIVGAVTTVHTTPTGSLANLVIASCFLWLVGFALSWSSLPWVNSAEIGSAVLRDKTVAASAWSGFGVGLIVTFVTPYIQNPGYGNLGASIGWIWSGISFASIFYVYFLLPELKGKTLEDIDRLFEARTPARHFANVSSSTESLNENEDAKDDTKADINELA